MEWIVLIAIAGYLYYRFVIVKSGNLNFWKVVNRHPEKAYAFFQSNNSFVVFNGEPSGGYRANLPEDEWDGPFRLYVPSQGRFVIIYGQVPEYQIAQEHFIKSLHV